MSPRRRVEPTDGPLFAAQTVPPPRQWRLPIMFAVAGLVVVEAITACTLMLISHEMHRRTALRNVSVLAYVRSFMTFFSSPDPFHANDYVDRVLAQATGGFEKDFRERANEALLRIATASETHGTVLDAGVERWNDDGSANVLVAIDVAAKAADGKTMVDFPYRWLVTAEPEGNEWKISNLILVI